MKFIAIYTVVTIDNLSDNFTRIPDLDCTPHVILTISITQYNHHAHNLALF